MAVTEASPPSGAARPGETEETAARAEAPPRRAAVLASGDHKTTGRLFIGAALVFAVVSGVAGGLIGAERVDVGDYQILSDQAVAAAFTMHDVSGVFLFLLPLFLGFAIYVVPLQVGASTIAFPRAATAAFWTWLLSGLLLLTSYAIEGGPAGTDRNGVLLWIAALAAVVAALGLATVCVVATALTLRTTGLSLDRLPLFSWSMVVAGTVWLMSLGVAFGGLVLLWLDVRYGVELLTSAGGGIYSHLVWLFRPPQIFAFAVPALGMVGEFVPVFARIRLARRDVVLGLLGAAAALGFGGWMFILPEYPDLTDEALYIGMSVALLLPVLGYVGGIADALRRGKFSMAPPVLGGLLGALLILAGAAATAFGALPFNELIATTWYSGVAHLVLGGAAVAALGGLYYWAPKIWGRLLPVGSGVLAMLAAGAGVVLLAVPDLITGAQGQDSRLPASQEAETGWEILNTVSVAGGGLLVLAVLLAVVSLAGALAGRDREPASDDPWEGHTLEWAAPSPPPIGNFVEAPVVESATPLLDRRETSPAETGADA